MSLKKIGIRREDINPWEKRVPLVPSHVEELIREHGIEVFVQPSKIRIFEDDSYVRAGASVQENICPSRIVFAIKEVPIELLEKGKIYVFFSHTIKGQSHNMPMLKKMMELGCSLIDYERMVNEKGQRVIFFGSFAGQAGMIDTLWALGRRLKNEGIETPFLHLDQACHYKSLVDAKEAVQRVAGLLGNAELPGPLRPCVCGFLGYGHVSRGAQDIFDMLPHEAVAPRDLPALFREKGSAAKGLYKVVFKEEDMVRPRDPRIAFELGDYFKNPHKYFPVIEDYLPYLTLLINGIYWTPKFPRFITKRYLQTLYCGSKTPRLKVIGDITCDIDGSVECTVKATDSERPVYVFDTETGRAVDGFEGRGPVVMAVYNLPAELPVESSTYFSGVLKAYVPALLAADFQGDFASIIVPDEIKRAVILHRGALTPDYEYLKPFIV